MLFKSSILDKSYFIEPTIKSIAFEVCDLSDSEINKANLRGVDVSDSIIDRVSFDYESLRGLINDSFQATALV